MEFILGLTVLAGILVAPLLLPTALARKGIGSRGTWLGARAGCLLTFMVLIPWNILSSRRPWRLWGDPSLGEYLLDMFTSLSGMGVVASGLGAAFYKPKRKEPGILDLGKES